MPVISFGNASPRLSAYAPSASTTHRPASPSPLGGDEAWSSDSTTSSSGFDVDKDHKFAEEVKLHSILQLSQGSTLT